MARWRPFFALLLVLSLCGCGKKTRPVPPRTVVPAAVRDLGYELNEKGVTLSWSLPRRTVRGERLPSRITGFELLRAVMEEKDYCAGCPVAFGEPIELSVDQVVGGNGQGARYTEALLRPGHVYVYRVRTRIGWRLTSGDSNPVAFYWDTPLQAPQGLRLTRGDRELVLDWRPPAGRLDGTPIVDPVKYRVYRGGRAEKLAPLDPLVDATRYVDRSVVNGRRYFYQVRAVRLHGDSRAAGMASVVVSASPRDLTPPGAPRQVTALPVRGGVRVLWEAVSAADLGGYRIYRRPESATEPELIGRVGGGALSFLDRAPLAGPAYYSVTSIDQAEPVNESRFSGEAMVSRGE